METQEQMVPAKTGHKRSRVPYVRGRVVIGMTRVRKEVAEEIKERATRDGKSVSCVVNDLLEAALGVDDGVDVPVE